MDYKATEDNEIFSIFFTEFYARVEIINILYAYRAGLISFEEGIKLLKEIEMYHHHKKQGVKDEDIKERL